MRIRLLWISRIRLRRFMPNSGTAGHRSISRSVRDALRRSITAKICVSILFVLVVGITIGIGITHPEPIAALEASLVHQSLIAFVVLLLIVASLSWLLIRSLTRPFREVAARAKTLTEQRAAPFVGERGPSSEAEEDEAHVIGRAFDEMALRVEDLTSQQDDRRLFVAMAAHELRNPVAAIAGLSETLNTHLDRLTDDEEQGLVDSLLRQSRKLMRLSSVLLDLTQLEGGSARMEIEPLALAAAVADVLTITPIPASVALYREVGDDAVVLADEVRVQEIVVNLLTNAFRYGGPRVRVRTCAAEASWSLVVEDDGPGLSEDLVTRVFEPFVRGTSPAPGSSGLGLSIARATARAMAGELRYETCDRGARFVLTLPAALHALRPA